MQNTATMEEGLLVADRDQRPSDELSRLAALAREGDRAALDALLRAASPELMRLCVRLLGERQDGLDALQEAFIRICRALPDYDPRRPARPFLFRVAVRAAQDRRRRLVSRRHLSVVAVDDVPGQLADGGPDPEQSLGASQLGASIVEALAVLPGKERDAFVLRELEQLETSEVARILGCRQVTVRGHCHQARRRLQRWLERKHPELLEAR
jgi:RNA polymerase sigma factor (sigma-70 family)